MAEADGGGVFKLMLWRSSESPLDWFKELLRIGVLVSPAIIGVTLMMHGMVRVWRLKL